MSFSKRKRTPSLEDVYLQTSGQVFMNGLQALTRLPLVQIRRDRERGLNTGGVISGYRGSPLGGYDLTLERNIGLLREHDISFKPGVNEELAATIIWGSQQLHLSPGAQKQGVFGIWYGKGPGVDRSGDVFKHGTASGSSKHGGVLCIAGDDHAAKSSTVPHQSDHAFMSAIIPMLYPSSVSEYVEMGLLGIELSRYSGCWVALKVLSDTVESASKVDLESERREILLPEDFELPKDGLNLRWPDNRWEQDQRLQNVKPYAALAFARANQIDRITLDSPDARLGIVASGLAYENTMQALRSLGIDHEQAKALNLRVYKVGMPWPLEPQGVHAFAKGLEHILVLEDRREIIEHQLKQSLFALPSDQTPRITGKFDRDGQQRLPLSRELNVHDIANLVGSELLQYSPPEDAKKQIQEGIRRFEHQQQRIQEYTSPLTRNPYYCAGCPHSRSTKVPEGSRTLAGIGCHFMATWTEEESTSLFTQMGGEGAPWIGMQDHTSENHIFANLGDGTYFHSGILAIRQAVASKANITYKILYNQAIAMTGGQELDGPLSVTDLIDQLKAERVADVVVVSDDPDALDKSTGNVPLLHRDAMPEVMQRMAGTLGCTVIVYHQMCATEKRRMRKRGKLPQAEERVYINPDVCEGCGDCSVQSACVAIEPLETPLGRKRQINQSLCNSDLSCLKGFCPSFVTLTGAEVRREGIAPEHIPDLPQPESICDLDKNWNISLIGVGGTGLLTVNAVLGMAAFMDDLEFTLLDMAGLAQKGGTVCSSIKLGSSATPPRAGRIANGEADLLLAADSISAISADSIGLCSPERTHAVINSHLTPIWEFIRERDLNFQEEQVLQTLQQHTQSGSSRHDFTRISSTLLGDTIYTNMMLVGYALQQGLIPVCLESLEQAIKLNGTSVQENLQALALGRLLAHDAKAIYDLMPKEESGPRTLDEVVAHRSTRLQQYQDGALAQQYREAVERVASASREHDPEGLLAMAVAHNYAKLLAYKDEYEVARLFTRSAFTQALNKQFTGNYKLKFHLSPAGLARMDPYTSRPRKYEFGPWILKAFKLFTLGKRLRGTRWDPFGYSAERRGERQAILDYEDDMKLALELLGDDNLEYAQRLLALPDQIRGFGPVKLEAMERARDEQVRLRATLNGATPVRLMESA